MCLIIEFSISSSSFPPFGSHTPITLVGINSLFEVNAIDFYWKWIYKLERVNKMFTSPSVLIIPVDTSDEWPGTEIWG